MNKRAKEADQLTYQQLVLLHRSLYPLAVKEPSQLYPSLFGGRLNGMVEYGTYAYNDAFKELYQCKSQRPRIETGTLRGTATEWINDMKTYNKFQTFPPKLHIFEGVKDWINEQEEEKEAATKTKSKSKKSQSSMKYQSVITKSQFTNEEVKSKEPKKPKPQKEIIELSTLLNKQHKKFINNQKEQMCKKIDMYRGTLFNEDKDKERFHYQIPEKKVKYKVKQPLFSLQKINSRNEVLPKLNLVKDPARTSSIFSQEEKVHSADRVQLNERLKDYLNVGRKGSLNYLKNNKFQEIPMRSEMMDNKEIDKVLNNIENWSLPPRPIATLYTPILYSVEKVLPKTCLSDTYSDIGTMKYKKDRARRTKANTVNSPLTVQEIFVRDHLLIIRRVYFEYLNVAPTRTLNRVTVNYPPQRLEA
ncbi:hypothetical protein SNEBB_001947 [Seison nebaliae]|nr:hypothetical protein SNEBB_001947 [Seison nebaliae]